MMQGPQVAPEILWTQLRDDEHFSLTRLPQLQVLEAEEAIRVLHRTIAPHARELAPPVHWLTYLGMGGFLIQAVPELVAPVAIGLLLLGILSTLIAFLPECHKRRQRAERLLQVLGELTPRCHETSIAGELLDFSGWLEHAPESALKRGFQAELARLLTRVSESDLAKLLTPERRKHLRSLCAGRRTRPKLIRAALLVLASVGDTATLPIARRLTGNRVVADAAEAFLDVVR